MLESMDYTAGKYSSIYGEMLRVATPPDQTSVFHSFCISLSLKNYLAAKYCSGSADDYITVLRRYTSRSFWLEDWFKLSSYTTGWSSTGNYMFLSEFLTNLDAWYQNESILQKYKKSKYYIAITEMKCFSDIFDEKLEIVAELFSVFKRFEPEEMEVFKIVFTDLCVTTLYNCYREFCREISNPHDWLSVQDVAVLSIVGKTDIHVVDYLSDRVKYSYTDPSNTRTIVLGSRDNYHIESLGIAEEGKIVTCFTPTHPFIVNLLSPVNNTTIKNENCPSQTLSVVDKNE